MQETPKLYDSARRQDTRSRALAYLTSASISSAAYSERHFRPLAILCLFIPAAYFVDLYVGKPSFDTLLIRIAAFIAVVPLIFHDSRIIRRYNYLHFYFVCTAAYVLPFTFGLMLVMNAATTPEGQQSEMLWVFQYFIALFLFIQLIHNGFLATVLWVISCALAMSPLIWLADINYAELKRVIFYPLTGYLTALVFGVLTNRNVDYVNSEKLKAASAIGGYIAHELRTPLASMGALSRAVQKNLSALCDGYAKAVDAGLVKPAMPNKRIKDLSEALELIKEEVNYSNTIIDMLLLNTKEHLVLKGTPERFMASDVIDEAIRRFPFSNSDERQRVKILTEHDFEINASRLFIIHVLFNLTKNGVYYMQRSPNGSVLVSSMIWKGQDAIEISDTGPGMPLEVRRRVFDRFFTTTEAGQGAGIGLSFCKMVMEGIGGEIQCDSKEGEYTTFRLIFPDVSRD